MATERTGRLTIIEALKKAIRRNGRPLSAREAYDAVVRDNLYEFHAQKPAHVVQTQLRRHCVGIDFPSAEPTKHFRLVDENRFWPLDKPKQRSATRRPKHDATESRPDSLISTFLALQALHREYVESLRRKILADLKRMSPASFEAFAKRLLDVYGFVQTQVTRLSGDGGIDGYGRLRVGLAHLNVAFQCKRWTRSNIQRTEIDKFRGAIQGDFEQGVFFTTTSYSKGAIDVSIRRGAVPIVLVDGRAIVELMIDKRFGIQTEILELPTYALDLELAVPERTRTPVA